MKDLLLCVRVCSLNLESSRCHLLDYVKELCETHDYLSSHQPIRTLFVSLLIKLHFAGLEAYQPFNYNLTDNKPKEQNSCENLPGLCVNTWIHKFFANPGII